jgi:DNA-binding transcriptional regulator/RsmH inhibitor MraZ
MQTTVRMRIPAQMKDALQVAANGRKTSISAEVREALSAYIDGTRTLSADPAQTMKNTTFVCDHKDLTAFKTLVKQAGMSFDEALRIALSQHLEDHLAQHPPKS